MPHPSDQDPEEHSTVLMEDSQGVEVAKGHVTTDESKQEVGSSPSSCYQYSMSWLTAHRLRAKYRCRLVLRL